MHPWLLRLLHLSNALAVLVMVTSGWRIYNASPLFPFRFPDNWTLGGWLAGALQWHFAAMWWLAANAVLYLGFNLVGGRWRRRLKPPRRWELERDLRAWRTGQLTHDDPLRYNAIQRLAYVLVSLDLLLLMLSGLALWKPVQLATLAAGFGGYEGARLVHFGAMAGLVLFIIIHVFMALRHPRSLRAMVLGR